MPQPSLTDADVAALRTATIDAVLRLFESDGSPALSMRRIATEVGYTPMALYRYFPKGSDEILAATRVRGYKMIASAISNAVENVVEPLEIIRAGWEAFVAFSLEHPNEFRIIYEYADGDWKSFPELDEAIDNVWQPTIVAVQAAVDAGLLAGEPEELAYLFWAALHGVFILYVTGEIESADEFRRVTHAMVELNIRGARP